MAIAAYSVKQIAEALGADAFGAVDLTVKGIAEPQTASADDLALATNKKYAERLSEGHAKVAILWEGADWQALGLKAAIVPHRPRFAMAGLSKLLDPGQGGGPGIHPSAIIDPTAEIGADVSVGPMTIVAAGARVGAGSIIGPQCYIGWNAMIGPRALLREQVSIGARVSIGADFIAQPGARVGGDGFSFVTEERSGVEAARATLGDQEDTVAQSWTRIHSLGSVTIGDNVEMGMNSCIDSGSIRDTVVGDGTKIDNLVHIGHNVIIGKDCLLCGMAGIAGSTRIGNNVVLGGQTGLSDNIEIGDRVITGGGTKVLTSVPAGRMVLGYPATKMDKQMEIIKSLRRLPRLFSDVTALKKAVFKSDANG